MVVPQAMSNAGYPATDIWGIDPNLSLKMATLWDNHPKWLTISIRSTDGYSPSYSATARCPSTLSPRASACRATPAGGASSASRTSTSSPVASRWSTPTGLGLGLSVFILIRTSKHDPDWLKRFRDAAIGFPEITGVYRMSG